MKDDLIDHYTLTFADNSEPIVEVAGGKIVPSAWLRRVTNDEVKFVSTKTGCVEIAIPIPIFLQIVNDRKFQGKCSKLVRLRLTKMSVLTKLCYPVAFIDNKI